MYITICRTDASASLMHEEGSQSRWSGTIQRDWVGRKVGGQLRIVGTHVYLWLIHVNVWQKPSQYCNNSPIEINFKNKSKDSEECISHSKQTERLDEVTTTQEIKLS